MKAVKSWQVVKKPRIEMVPLIDCFFLILVFFIYGVLSMVVQRGISLELPKVAHADVNREDYLSISVSKEGQAFFNRQPVSIEELPLFLEQDRLKNPKQKVFINADKFAYHGTVINILDIVRRAGIRQVYFQAESEKNE